MAQLERHYGKWRVRWKSHLGKRESKSFPSRPEALFFKKQKELELEEIKRGLVPAPPCDKLFDELCNYWIEKRATLKRSGRDDESIIGKHLRPFFGRTKIKNISVADTDNYSLTKSHLSKKTLANQLTLLISMLNLAKDLKWISEAPKIKKPKVRLFSKDYRYLKTREEINRFLNAAKNEGDLCFVMYAFALFTGMREGEIAATTWEDIDFERRLITVQRSFNGPTKADDVRYVPILDSLLPILLEWKLKSSGTLVFQNQNGTMFGESARIFQEVLKRVLKAGGFPQGSRGGKPSGYITFHDLRHTFASHWMMAGGDLFKLQKILGHKTIQMTMRYCHLSPNAFAEDFNRLPHFQENKNAQLIVFPAT
jgi:integrase